MILFFSTYRLFLTWQSGQSTVGKSQLSVSISVTFLPIETGARTNSFGRSVPPNSRAHMHVEGFGSVRARYVQHCSVSAFTSVKSRCVGFISALGIYIWCSISSAHVEMIIDDRRSAMDSYIEAY